jgi:hypothetical protein
MLKDKVGFNPEELMRGAKPALAVAEVTKRLIKEKAYELIDENRLKRDKAYSGLLHQVVGAEYF